MQIADGIIDKFDMKRHNRMRALRFLQEHGKVSRNELSEELNSTRTGINVLVAELIEQQIIEEYSEVADPAADVHKGRKQTLLGLNPTYRFALGACVSEDNVTVGLVTMSVAIMEKKTIPIDEDTTMVDIAILIREQCERMLENCCLNPKSVVGLGVGIMPEMLERIGMKHPKTGMYQFDNFEALIQQNHPFSVYVSDAIPQMAIASGTYGKSEIEDAYVEKNIGFLYAIQDTFHLSVVYQHQIREEFCWSTEIGNQICVNPGGRKAEGCCRGSVQAELTPTAIGRKVNWLYGADKTPELYAITGGDCSVVHLSEILTAVENGDELLEDIKDDLLSQFCMLLVNIKRMYFCEVVSLHGFGFTETNLEMIRQHLEWFGLSQQEREQIRLCSIKQEHQFFGAAQYAIDMGFYANGAMSDQLYDTSDLASMPLPPRQAINLLKKSGVVKRPRRSKKKNGESEPGV